MLPYCGKITYINWQKLRSAICRLPKRKCMLLVKSSTVSVSKPLFRNLLSNLSVISGYCSQNLQLRVANKSFSYLSIRVSVLALTFCYCVSNVAMLSIRYQSQPTIWVTGGRRIKPCLNKSNSRRLMSLTKIFAEVLIKKGNVVADVIVKNQKHRLLITQHLIRTVQSKTKPMTVLKKVEMIKQW